MRRFGVILLVSILIVGLAPPAADAGHRTATNVALGLASFAVFNQLVGPLVYPRPVYAAPVYLAAPPYQVIYAAPPQLVVVQPPPPPAPTVVYYPHGRYELRASGTQYFWVWIPNAPPPPPAGYQQPSLVPSPPATAPPASPPSASEACKPTGKYVKTPQGLLPECE